MIFYVLVRRCHVTQCDYIEGVFSTLEKAKKWQSENFGVTSEFWDIHRCGVDRCTHKDRVVSNRWGNGWSDNGYANSSVAIGEPEV